MLKDPTLYAAMVSKWWALYACSAVGFDDKKGIFERTGLILTSKKGRTCATTEIILTMCKYAQYQLFTALRSNFHTFPAISSKYRIKQIGINLMLGSLTSLYRHVFGKSGETKTQRSRNEAILSMISLGPNMSKDHKWFSRHTPSKCVVFYRKIHQRHKRCKQGSKGSAN